ncbi:MAG: glycosyltransferase family 4 protein [Candidatus Omnitrophota bacterium]
MKILMFSSYVHPHIGGVEKHVKRLSEELINKGHCVSIITAKYDQALADFEEFNKIKIYRFSNMNLTATWIWIYRHRKILKNVDIIHCHDFYTFIYWYLPFRFLYLFKPVFITFHGFEGIIPIPKKILFLRKASECLTKGNICIGDYIPKWYGTKASFVLYGGADETEAVGVTVKNSAIFIGRLEKDTGIMAYLNAVKVLKEKHAIGLEVNICGDGSLREKIEKFIEENKLNIKLYGFVEEPANYLSENKFAFVSGYLAILEAMVRKKLVFAIYENALKKDYLALIPNSKDIMVIASSPEELARKIAHYRNYPEKSEEMIKNAYDFAKELKWDGVADVYLKLWNSKYKI